MVFYHVGFIRVNKASTIYQFLLIQTPESTDLTVEIFANKATSVRHEGLAVCYYLILICCGVFCNLQG